MNKEIVIEKLNENGGDKRLIYFDVLRIFATLAVVILHISGQNWSKPSVYSFEWNVFNFFDSIVRWAVPVFVMISGALFLNPKKVIDTKVLYKKNILRIVVAFIFWSLIYVIASFFIFKTQQGGIKVLIKEFLNGYNHLWFLYMIVGLYIITPILRKITEDTKIMEYFLGISLVFTIIIPMLFKIPVISNIASTAYAQVNFHLTLGYSSYFVLGYYLSQKEFSLKTRRIIYIVSILAFIFTILGSAIISQYKNKPFGIYGNLYPNILLEAVGVFLLIKNIKWNMKPKTKKIIILLSKYSFGTYLVHELIIMILRQIGITTLSFNAMLSVPIMSIVVFAISLVISIGVNHIPILKKYIV